MFSHQKPFGFFTFLFLGLFLLVTPLLFIQNFNPQAKAMHAPIMEPTQNTHPQDAQTRLAARTEGFSAKQPAHWTVPILEQSWHYYKTSFLANGERVMSNNYDGTISEGQSYTLLKSVWMNDPTTFDKAWHWTQDNMQRDTDHLFGWRWGYVPGSKTKKRQRGLVYEDNASDGDQDIAYALLLAGKKWNKPAYIREAKLIITDLWRLNVRKVKGHYYLLPGTWEDFVTPDLISLNPSYMAPYVYQKFALYDPAHAKGWRQLANDIYPTLEACSNLKAHRLPLDWCGINPDTGIITFSEVQGDRSRDFGYDAIRVFWRMGMVVKLTGDPRAKAYLRNHQTLRTYWNKQHKLPAGFGRHDQPQWGAEGDSGFTRSALAASLNVLEPHRARQHYNALLGSEYGDDGFWFNDYNDFLHSVVWFHTYTLSPLNNTP